MLKGFRFIGSPRVGVHKLEALAEREIFHGRPQLMLIYLGKICSVALKDHKNRKIPPKEPPHVKYHRKMHPSPSNSILSGGCLTP